MRDSAADIDPADLVLLRELTRERVREMRAELLALRDEIAPAGDPSMPWIWLSAALGLDEDVADQLAGVGADNLPNLYGADVERILLKYSRWNELGLMLRSPAWDVAASFDDRDRWLGMRSRSAEDRAKVTLVFRERAAILYAGCLVAGRDEEGGAIVRVMLDRDDPGPVYLLLVETAIRAGVARTQCRQWLRRAKELGQDTAEAEARLDDALGRD